MEILSGCRYVNSQNGDHIYGLFPLLDTLALSQRSHPLQVYAPAPLGDLLNCISSYLNGGCLYNIEYHEVDAASHQMVYEDKGVVIRTVPLKHRVPAVGYYCREKAPGLNIRKEVISHYSLGIDDILALKRGEDLRVDGKLISNEQLTYTPYIPRSYALNGHSTSVEAACIALLAGAEKLLVGHFSRRYRNPSQLVEEARRIFPNTEEAVEGKTYEVE